MDILRLLRIAALLSVVLVLNTAVVLMVTQARGPVSAQVTPPCVTGDANGDSLLDIGDPIYLLGHLFSGGPAPVACAQTTQEDIAAAVDTALGRYLPRAGERVFLDEIPILPTETVDIISVPIGRVFRLEWYSVLEGNPTIPPEVVHALQISPIELGPGETFTVTNEHPNIPAALRLWGHWLDYTP
jgi:hypothetical protein